MILNYIKCSLNASKRMFLIISFHLRYKLQVLTFGVENSFLGSNFFLQNFIYFS